METYADLIECDDVLIFANAAMTSTGQREFHGTAGEQRLSLDFLHRYVQGNYPDLYAASLALDLNDHNAALIIANLLSGHAGDGRLIAPSDWRARCCASGGESSILEARRASCTSTRSTTPTGSPQDGPAGGQEPARVPAAAPGRGGLPRDALRRPRDRVGGVVAAGPRPRVVPLFRGGLRQGGGARAGRRAQDLRDPPEPRRPSSGRTSRGGRTAGRAGPRRRRSRAACDR
ncbi:hypothetical protein H4W80_008655 [Nonomuraea angiospora]|uniref:Uncharacterized protein n=1 Tax=Nonomuraea angiospora TaxID=46172 RepID=A0ABR9MD30_9ACTN|nr:hypothetical protein [Nonomuraea angiospora]